MGPRLARRLAAAFALVALAALVVLAWAPGLLLTHSAAEGPPPPDMPYEAVRLVTADGIGLAAWWVPAPEPKAALVLVHDMGSSKSDPDAGLAGLAADLAGRNYSVLAIDMRGHGQSDAAPGGPSLGPREAADVRAAVAWLARVAPGLRVAALGIGVGGAAAAYAMEGEARIEALVAVDLFPDARIAAPRALRAATGLPDWAYAPVLWSLERLHGLDLDASRPAEVLPRLGRPVLLVQNMADPLVTLDEARALAAGASGSILWTTPPRRPSEAVQWAGFGRWGGHGHSYVLYRDAFVERVAAFLDAVFGTQFG
jgi:pimeloyl-ACP methyl ester carboxylesterase